MPPLTDPYLAIAPFGCEPAPNGKTGGRSMRRSIFCATRTALLWALCGAWLAVATTAQATAISGVPVPGRAALEPLLPAQGQPAQNVEGGIAMLHQRLGITPAQEPAFAGLANVMRENARASMVGAPPANADAVEQLRLAIQYGQQEINDMRRMLPALQTLYASLSPAQRAIANQVFRQGPGR
jgi:periplasmic protein CpxP/Spy